MRKLFNILFVLLPLLSYSQKKDSEFTYVSQEEVDLIVPVNKESETIGRCCRLGKALAKMSGGLTDAYVIQSEKNSDGSYTIFYLQGFMQYDKEITRYADGNWQIAQKIHLSDEKKFHDLNYYMIEGSRGFKASPIKRKEAFIDISDILEGGENEGDNLFLYFYNDKIVKYVQLMKFDKETGYKSASANIFSKFIEQLFGSDEVLK